MKYVKTFESFKGTEKSVVNEGRDWGTYGTPEAKTVTKALDKALAKFESSLEKAHDIIDKCRVFSI